jgi:hypothetical protein
MNDTQRKNSQPTDEYQGGLLTLIVTPIINIFERRKRITLAKELGLKVEPMSFGLSKLQWFLLLIINGFFLFFSPLFVNLSYDYSFNELLGKAFPWCVSGTIIVYLSILLYRSAKESLGKKIPTFEELGQAQLKNAIGAKDWATESQLQTAL